MERVVVNALAGLHGDLTGKYYSLTEMTEKEQQQLIDVRICLDKWSKWSYIYYSMLGMENSEPFIFM